MRLAISIWALRCPWLAFASGREIITLTPFASFICANSLPLSLARTNNRMLRKMMLHQCGRNDTSRFACCAILSLFANGELRNWSSALHLSRNLRVCRSFMMLPAKRQRSRLQYFVDCPCDPAAATLSRQLSALGKSLRRLLSFCAAG